MHQTNLLVDTERHHILNHHVSFFGSFAQQTPRAFLSLNRLLNVHDFTTIIELGHHDGGLTTLFALYCAGSRQPAVADDPNEPSLYKNRTHHKRPKTLYTFDNVMRDIPRTELCVALGAHFAKVDFLDDPKIVMAIGGLIQKPGTTLVLCDGGDKVREVGLYAPFLKPGDFIMAHDWAADQAAHEDLKTRGIWSAWETWWDNHPSGKPGIKTACEANGVVQVYPEEFDDAAWFCGWKAVQA